MKHFFQFDAGRLWRLALCTIVFALADLPSRAEPAEPLAVTGLVERLLPGHGKDFVFETIPAPMGENVFEVAGKDGKIVLRGDGVLSQCVALNYYLTHTAKVSVSLYAEVSVGLPDTLPVPAQSVRQTTKLPNRFFINYCTFGYAFPWWTWRNWERFIDWMALQGINLPLAQGASEAIWQKVWLSYGLTDDEIRGGYFTGPAHLPWHRMGNLDKWDGPLPQSYIDGQLALTKKIVARERELGMQPVLPAFAGHVPPALKRVRPEAKLNQLRWCGVSTMFIEPQDPLFREIQVKFLRAQEKELGSDHRYSIDPFNEMAPPSMDPAYLGSVSKGIYDALIEADPQAVWVQMSWAFAFIDWPNRSLEGLINGVPKGRMVLLDYFCEKNEMWRKHKFFGAPFIWNYLGNFGGNTPLAGPVNKINRQLTAALADKSLDNLTGIGSTLEGLNNQAIHEFLFARAWAGTNCDVDAWCVTKAQAHAGKADPAAEEGFRIFWKEVLGDRTFTSVSDCFTMRPQLAGGGIQGYDSGKLARAWQRLLDAGPETRRREGYRLDLADITRTALAQHANDVRGQLFAAWKKGDAGEFNRLAPRFLEIGNDLDTFLGTRPEYLFGYWVNQARAWGKDAAEADYYEKNARTIVTTWFRRSNALNNYANRDWNGLLKEFYLVRWKMYLDAMGASLEAATGTGKPPVDVSGAHSPKQLDFEWNFARTAGGRFPAKAQGDTYEVSKALFEKYRSSTNSPESRVRSP